MARVVIGMDPHKRSATIEVLDEQEKVLSTGRFGTDREGYRNMLAAGRRWPQRVWAVEGCQGVGRHLAQRLVADNEPVLDVPAKLSARARVFSTGQGRKTDLLTELPEGFLGLSVRLPIGVATFPARDQRWGWVAGAVRFGGAAARVA